MMDVVFISGYENTYLITSHGEIIRNGKVRKVGVTRTGYQSVVLCKNGVMKNYRVHRLVAEAFIPNPDNKPHVNHINGDKTDNRVENLEWVTQSENMQHAYSSGLRNPMNGTKHTNSKLTESQVREMRHIYSLGHVTIQWIADLYNVSHNSISRIINNKTWKHV